MRRRFPDRLEDVRVLEREDFSPGDSAEDREWRPQLSCFFEIHATI